MNMKTVQRTVTNIRERVHPHCVVCSPENTHGLRLHFDVIEDGSIKADFNCDRAYEGYPGVLHGGIIFSIIDGAMSNCVFAQGQAAVTVEMTTRFRHPVMIGRQATVSARITRNTHSLRLLEAEIVQNGDIKVTAKGKFYDLPEVTEVLREGS